METPVEQLEEMDEDDLIGSSEHIIEFTEQNIEQIKAIAKDIAKEIVDKHWEEELVKL